MSWRVLGLVRVIHADGPDVSRSAAGRVGGEAIWVPTALLPRFGVTWTATDSRHISANYRLDEADIELHYTLDDDDARVRSVVFDRWGDPDTTGTWGQHHPAGPQEPDRHVEEDRYAHGRARAHVESSLIRTRVLPRSSDPIVRAPSLPEKRAAPRDRIGLPTPPRVLAPAREGEEPPPEPPLAP